MDRRSFVMSIFGGLAAASVGGTAFAASRKADGDAALATAGDLDAATQAGLDKADADFNQVVVRERVVVRRPRPYRRPYRRPVVVRRTVVRRPRRVVVRRRVIVR